MRSRFRNKNQVPCLTEANQDSIISERPMSPISPGSFLNSHDTLANYIQTLTPKKQSKDTQYSQQKIEIKYVLPESFSTSSPKLIRIQPQAQLNPVAQSPKHVFFRQKTTEIDFVNNIQSDGQLKSDQLTKQSIFKRMAEQLIEEQEPPKKREHFRTQSQQLTVPTSQDDVIDVLRTKTYKKTSHFKQPIQ